MKPDFLCGAFTIFAAIGLNPINDTLAQSSNTSVNFHVAHYNRQFIHSKNDLAQTGSSAIFKHKHSFLNNRVTLSGAAYTAQKLSASGRIREDLLTVKHNRVDGFSLIGEATVKIKPVKNLSIELGRTQHRSLLLQSKTRLLPSTFEGISLNWQPTQHTRIHAHRFTKWSPRANAHFKHFSTNVSDKGAIKSIRILGLEAKLLITEKKHLTLTAEYLESNHYLRKLGMVAAFKQELNHDHSAGLNASLLVSTDAGNLFIDGANDALDIPTNISEQRQHHDGLGAYLTASYNIKNHHLALSLTKIGNPWLEDSFAGDHGTTPFPTKTFGPELTNKRETVWLAQYKYKWRLGPLTGLSSKIAYAKGQGIENSIDPNLGRAEEQWWYAELHYRAPWSNNFDARLRYRDYKSTITGEVAGVRNNRNELRLDFNYKIDF